MAWLSRGRKSAVQQGLALLLEPRLLFLLGAIVELVKRPKDDARCEHLGQRDGRLPWKVKDVGRHATASEFAERRGDGFIMLGPVGPDQHDPGVMQAPPHIRPIEHSTLIN